MDEHWGKFANIRTTNIKFKIINSITNVKADRGGYKSRVQPLKRNRKTQKHFRKIPRIKSMKPKKRLHRRKTKSAHKKRATKKH